MAVTWGVACPSDFDWREWDGDIVLFVTATGDTHEMAPDASTLLSAMLQNRALKQCAASWLTMITTEPDGSPATDVTDAETRAFEHLLGSLKRIGVVTQHST